MLTNYGVSVHSAGEQKIANWLEENNIEFKYDQLIRWTDGEFKQCRPDFILTDYPDVFIEYWGMAGDPEYDQKTQEKIRTYRNYKIRLISIWPSSYIEEKLEEKLRNNGIY